MGKVRIIVLSFVVLGAIAVIANVAGASNGATTTPFKFTDTAGGVSCTGVHILKTGSKPVHKESETCTDTVGYFSPGTYAICPGYCWVSDYHLYILHEPHPVDPADPNVAISGTIVVTDNGNGTFTWNVVSYYPVSS
jgi:hypothetical protein